MNVRVRALATSTSYPDPSLDPYAQNVRGTR